MQCSRCAANLPDGSQFCLMCGQPVTGSAITEGAPEVVPAQLPRPRPKRLRVIGLLLLVLLIVGALWVVTSNNPVAQEIQELAGPKHDETILETPFSVGPHTFRYYKFSLPEGSANVAVVGQFTATAANRSNEKAADKNTDSDNTIQVYVLTESAFTVWQSGYATSSEYESGKVSQAAVQAELPAGAGVYYLVFSNKFSPRTAKKVQATFFLRYKRRSLFSVWVR